MQRRPMFRPWQRWMAARTPPAEVLRATTSDGVELAIHRVPPRPGVPRRGAVMLLHGLASNRYAFHFPGRSLAAYLAGRGFDCFVPELRGAGLSQVPHLRWDVHDYVLYDIPAILGRIRRVIGDQPLHWIGHSMGGILFLLHSARGGNGVKSGIAVASALDYRHGSVFQALLRLRPVMERLPYVPFGGLTHLLAPLSGRLPRLDELNFAPDSTEPELIRLAQANVFGRVPIPLLESLATLLAPEGPVCKQSGLRYRDATANIRTPLLMLGGSRDVQCPVAAVEHTASLLPNVARAEAFGRPYGHGQDYGHFCLLLGRRAPLEVWPRISDWLERS